MKARKLFAFLSLAGALLLGMSSCDNEEDLTDLYQKLNGKWNVESNIETITLGMEGIEPIQDTMMMDGTNSIVFFSNMTLTMEDEYDTTEGTYEYLPELSKLVMDFSMSGGNGRRRSIMRMGGYKMTANCEFEDENTLKLITEYEDRVNYEDLYYQYDIDITDYDPDITEEQLYDDTEFPITVHRVITLKRVTE
ncbi:MAG: hypothetical protein J6Z12_03715 [Paludibacteraceae bacterium]|nr:hypothetical protein [Paludibacteraceae bacterium]